MKKQLYEMGETGGREQIVIPGVPNERQKEFFRSDSRFTAYGGARGGGKSWALRRKLTAMCLRYAGLRCLLVRRSLEELRSNHVQPFLRAIHRGAYHSSANHSPG